VGRLSRWPALPLLLAAALAAPAPSHAVAEPLDGQYVADHDWLDEIRWNADQPKADRAYPVIAIVDSGIWGGFDDFVGYLDDTSADCTSGVAERALSPWDVDDSYHGVGHGTKVAMLAAAPINGVGAVGVSPFSPVVAVRITTNGDDLRPACAFRYLKAIARSQPLVVNLSFEMAQTAADQKALDDLVAAGALVVAAAGNEPTADEAVRWPARSDHVLSVAATSGGPARDAHLDVAAPGAGLTLPRIDGSWGVDGGTSYAAGIVSGAAALVWGQHDTVTNPQVITYLLRKTATASTRWSATTGYGTIDLRRALAARPPRIDEFEPNDVRPRAFRKACPRACTLNGALAAGDDPVDFWQLRNRRRCPFTRRATAGYTARCRVSGSSVSVEVRVRPSARPWFGVYAIPIGR
jgi:subtilisin family serine protease